MRPCRVAVLDKEASHCLWTAPCLAAFGGLCVHQYNLVGVLDVAVIAVWILLRCWLYDR